MVINTHVDPAPDHHRKRMLSAGNLNIAARVVDRGFKIAVTVRIGLAEQQLAVHHKPAERKPDDGSEQVGKHIPVALERAGGNRASRRHDGSACSESPLRAPVTLKIGSDTEDFREIVLNTAAAAIERSRLSARYGGIELNIRVIPVDIEPL